MTDRSFPFGRPSLRRRFAIWFGAVFVIGAVALRASHYLATVDTLARDLDVQVWSRLAALKAEERFAPDALLDPRTRADHVFLNDLPARSGWAAPRILGVPIPALEPPADTGAFRWFAGVWQRDGALVDDLDLPVGVAWDPSWPDRIDTLWTSADGRHRLAATAGAYDTVLLVGAPLEPLAAAKRAAGRFQVLTFVVWVPFVLGVAWLALSRAFRPMARVTATARRIRAGRFDERIDVARADAEFADMAETLNDMLDRLDAIREAQSRFNADVAHQLLNPVHTILLETEAAARTPRPPGELVASLNRVDSLARRIEGLCSTFLTWSRSAALDPARLARVDLEPIVEAAVERVAEQAKARGVVIEAPPEGVVVQGDPALLEEVFVNLLVNAADHSPAGGRIQCVVRADASGRRVAVVDHGTGVAEADVPRLFDHFHTGRPAGGHGIGLALSRRIMRSHGGDLVHEPTPGGGATFALFFPSAAAR
ncbi:MAG: ATP-binding protein [Planctomycetia bacterium]